MMDSDPVLKRTPPTDLDWQFPLHFEVTRDVGTTHASLDTGSLICSSDISTVVNAHGPWLPIASEAIQYSDEHGVLLIKNYNYIY